MRSWPDPELFRADQTAGGPRGRPAECFANCARYVQNHPGFVYVEGYGSTPWLSADRRVWALHAIILNPDGEPVELTYRTPVDVIGHRYETDALWTALAGLGTFGVARQLPSITTVPWAALAALETLSILEPCYT